MRLQVSTGMKALLFSTILLLFAVTVHSQEESQNAENVEEPSQNNENTEASQNQETQEETSEESQAPEDYQPVDVTYDDQQSSMVNQSSYDESCFSKIIVCRVMPEGFRFTDVCMRECQCRNQLPACPRVACDPQVMYWFLNDEPKFLKHCKKMRDTIKDL